MARVSRCLPVVLLLTALGCQSEVEYQVKLYEYSNDLVISRADFDEGTCMTLLLTDSEPESGEQPVSGIRLEHRESGSIVPTGGSPKKHGPYVYARELPLELDECSPVMIEGEPLGVEGSGTIRFDRAVGSEQDGWDYSRVRFNVKIDGVRFRDTLDIATPPQTY